MKRIAFSIICLMTFLVGCQPKSEYEVVAFSGTLTHQGKPLNSQVLITFSPEKGRSSRAITDEKGNFKAIYTEKLNGVQKGKSTVTLAPYSSQFQFDNSKSQVNPELDELIKKYGFGRKGFEIEVTKASSNFKLDLP